MTQNSPATVASLRQRLDQIQRASMLQKPALIEQAVSEAVTLAEQQEKTLSRHLDRIETAEIYLGKLEDRIQGLEAINGVL